MSKVVRSWRDWELEYFDAPDPITNPDEDKYDGPRQVDDQLTCMAWVENIDSWDEAEEITDNYERAMLRRSNYICDLANHVMWYASIFRPDPEEGSVLVGQPEGDIFVVSHFAPASRRGGVAVLRAAAAAGTPFVFCVPENLAKQLVRLGFQDTGFKLPQYFNEEVIIKNVVVNKATTLEDLRRLAAKERE